MRSVECIIYRPLDRAYHRLNDPMENSPSYDLYERLRCTELPEHTCDMETLISDFIEEAL